MNRTLAVVAVLVSCIVIVSCGGSPSSQTQPPPTGSTVETGPHVLGTTGAKVTIVEFSDFQCPYCKAFYTDTESQIIVNYVNTGKAIFAYRQFPLAMHQNAEIAAEASECAANVGGNDVFWKYHDTLFTHGQGDGTGLDVASLKQYAADLQVDTARFDTCLDGHETSATVSKDQAAGTEAGVSGTPTFFINGTKIVGAQPFSTFRAAIDAALSKN